MTGVSGGGGLGGSVTSVSIVTANGISGSVATPATTPAITLSLGNITPTSINGLIITTTAGTLTIPNNASASLITSGNFAITLTATGITNVTLPTTGTLATTSNKLSDFASTSSTELATVITGETGSGALVFADTPTLVTPALGAATATSLNISYGNLTLTPVHSPGACTATDSGLAGNVDIGAHIWKVTFVTSIGETELGSSSNTVTIAASAKQVNLTAIPTGPTGQDITSRKIYRTKAGGSSYFLLTTIANNTATAYTDNTADVGLNAYDATNISNDTVWIYWAGNKSAILTTYNSAVGVNALYLNTTGYSNSAVGVSALRSNTTGVSNSAMGVNALYSNTTGGSNSAMGVGALRSNTTGVNNSAMGVNALLSNTTGVSNSAMGVSALRSNTTGGSNSAMGVNALYSNTTGVNNSAMGVDALYANTTGGNNSAMGVSALYSNTTGVNNSAMGVSALLSNTTGVNNSAMGVDALNSNTTGVSNSAMGVSALNSNTTGGSNSAMGVSALYSNTTGVNNSAMGVNALYSNTTGGNNSAMGGSAGRINTTGSQWTCIGSSAGYTGSTDALSNVTTLGYNAQVTASNACILGNGQFVGIGTTAPTTMLEILSADNTTAVLVKMNATSANVTAADTFIDFQSTDGSIGSIAGTAVSGTIIYNTFTGSHYSQIIDKTDLEIGTVLEIIDDNIPINFPEVDGITKVDYTELVETKVIIDDKEIITDSKQVPRQRIDNVKYKTYSADHLFKTRICETKGSKAAIGCYGGTDKEGRDAVLSIGTGFINVVNKGKDISVGDYFISSDIRGCAELQDDDIYRNNTLAKSTDNVKWDIGEIKRKTGCIYLGG